MTVEIIEIAGHKMAVLPIADYEKLVDLVEDRIDANVAFEAERRRGDGEEYLPASMVDRLIAGESPLKVWREHRGFTQQSLARTAATSKSYISHIECGARPGSVQIWRKLADILSVTVADIMPI